MSYHSKWRTAANTYSASETFASRGGIQDGNPQSTASSRIPRPNNNNNAPQSQHAASPQPSSQPYGVNAQPQHGSYGNSQLVRQISMSFQWPDTMIPHNNSSPTAGYQQGHQQGPGQTSPPGQSPTWTNQANSNMYEQPQYLQTSHLNIQYPVQHTQNQMFNSYANQGFDPPRTPERRTTTDNAGTWGTQYNNTGMYDRPVTPLHRVLSDPMTYTQAQAHSCHHYWNYESGQCNQCGSRSTSNGYAG